MKKVFEVITEDRTRSLMNTHEWTVFAESMYEAINKVNKFKADVDDITNAKLLCKVEEDSDLEKYLEE